MKKKKELVIKKGDKLPFLYNRRLAVPITVAVCVVMLLVGACGSLSSERSLVENVFYTGQDGDGRAVQPYLDERAAVAGNLCVVAARYLTDGNESVRAVRAAADELKAEATIHGKYAANVRLDAAFEVLYSELAGHPLSEDDAQFRARLYDEMKAKNAIISHCEYNNLAMAFNREMSAFPASQFAFLSGTRALELFG